MRHEKPGDVIRSVPGAARARLLRDPQPVECAIDQAGGGVLLTARAECYHVGHWDPLEESIRRLQAYAEAGADVLFAPGPQTTEEIEALVQAVRPKLLNLLVVRDLPLTVPAIGALGVRRISLGDALALTAWGAFTRAAELLCSEGRFSGLAGGAAFPKSMTFSPQICARVADAGGASCTQLAALLRAHTECVARRVVLDEGIERAAHVKL